MAFAAMLSRPPKCDVVEEHAIVADFGRLADHDAGSVVDEEASADRRARVDLDSRQKPPDRRDQTGQQRDAESRMQQVGDAVEEDRV